MQWLIHIRRMHSFLTSVWAKRWSKEHEMCTATEWRTFVCGKRLFRKAQNVYRHWMGNIRMGEKTRKKNTSCLLPLNEGHLSEWTDCWEKHRLFTDAGCQVKYSDVPTNPCLVHCRHLQHAAFTEIQVVQAHDGMRGVGFHTIRALRTIRRAGLSAGHVDADIVVQSRSVGSHLRDSLCSTTGRQKGLTFPTQIPAWTTQC